MLTISKTDVECFVYYNIIYAIVVIHVYYVASVSMSVYYILICFMT